MQNLQICRVKVVSEFSVEDCNTMDDMSDINVITKNMENIKLDIEPVIENTVVENPIIDNDHYISIIILYTDSLYNDIDKLDKTYFISNSVLCINNHIIPTYSIEYESGFKFKKFTREKVIDEFGFKNKDILGIKSIGTHNNFHNYLVLLNKNKRLNKYKNSNIAHKSTEYTWHTSLELYQPNRVNPKQEEIYIDISFRDNNKKLVDISEKNIIKYDSIYRSLIAII